MNISKIAVTAERVDGGESGAPKTDPVYAINERYLPTFIFVLTSIRVPAVTHSLTREERKKILDDAGLSSRPRNEKDNYIRQYLKQLRESEREEYQRESRINSTHEKTIDKDVNSDNNSEDDDEDTLDLAENILICRSDAPPLQREYFYKHMLHIISGDRKTCRKCSKEYHPHT